MTITRIITAAAVILLDREEEKRRADPLRAKKADPTHTQQRTHATTADPQPKDEHAQESHNPETITSRRGTCGSAGMQRRRAAAAAKMVQGPGL